MRKEIWGVGSWLHLVRRAARGIPFIRDDADRWRYLKVIYYLNDERADYISLREIIGMVKDGDSKLFKWPSEWPARTPLFSIVAFSLLDNHDHMIGLETGDDGISKFMQKSGVSRARYFNEKYNEKGSIFQGPYKAKVIDSDQYLLWAAPYVMIKNTFEMHPRGYQWAITNFEEAWQWAIRYPFSSLGDYAGVRNSPILDTGPLKKIIGGPGDFKRLCRDMLAGRHKTELNEYGLGEIEQEFE